MSQETRNIVVAADQVRNAVSNLVDREKNLLSNLDAVSCSIMTAADYLSILNGSTQVGTYKELMVSLGKLAHEVRAHQGVLQQLAQNYQPSLEETDFEALLDQRLSDRLSSEPYKPQNDERLKEFMELIGGEAVGGAGADELDDDEELRETETGRAWMNDKCPLSMREVLDLEQPVKDPLGYVYENESVMAYLRGHPNGHKHPVAGVTQLLKASDLKAANDVMRAKRRQRWQQMFGGGSGGSNRGPDRGTEDEEFIDV